VTQFNQHFCVYFRVHYAFLAKEIILRAAQLPVWSFIIRIGFSVAIFAFSILSLRVSDVRLLSRPALLCSTHTASRRYA
jgi:hypothetical protein